MRAMVLNHLSEHLYGMDKLTKTQTFCLHLEGRVMTYFKKYVSGGNYKSKNERFELQFDKMSTEGFFIYDYDLGRIVRSYTKKLYIGLTRRNEVLYGVKASILLFEIQFIRFTRKPLLSQLIVCELAIKLKNSK